jgi:flagellar protein FlaG
MASDIQNIPGANAPGQGKAAVVAPVAAAHPTTKTEAPVQLKLEVPKSPEIKFDPNKVRENLSAAIGMLNKQMEASKRGLGFSYDDSKKTAVVKVTDAASGEVVRQIPTEQVLKMAHQIDAYKGLLYNKVA